jgi:hypothetical protein
MQLTSFTADSLCGKWTRAKQGVFDTKPAFEQLTDCLDPTWIQEWTRQERVAMENRGEDLKVYDVASEKCRTLHWADSEQRTLIYFSTYIGGNTLQVGGKGGSTGESIRFSFRTHGGPVD